MGKNDKKNPVKNQDVKGKIKPVSPAKARLEKRENDEKIVRNIRFVFISFVVLAIIGLIIGLVLYVYKPAIATIAGEKVEDYEYQYFLSQAMQTMLQQADYTGEENTDTFWQSNIGGEKAIDVAKKNAMDNIRDFKMSVVKAKEEGITLKAEDKAAIDSAMSQIEEQATSYGYMDGRELVRAMYGISRSSLKKIYNSFYLTDNLAQKHMDEIVVTDEQAQTYYNDNAGAYEQASARHILFMFDGLEGERTQEESHMMAEDTLARINNGEDMTALVIELSEDNGTEENEGLYTFSRLDAYEPNFLNWAFDSNVGDTGIVETSYGYHVMRLEDKQVQTFETVKDSIISSIKNEQYIALVDGWAQEPRFELKINEKAYAQITN